MLSLLHDTTRPGYPADYILSRIRGRMEVCSSGAFADQKGGGTFQDDDALIWNSVAREHRWIYLQMDNNLREILAPLFVYFELQTLVLCLRTLESHQPEASEVNFEQSLLAEGVKKIVSSPDTTADVVEKLEKKLGKSVISLDGLVTAYEKGGVQRCEEFIRKRFFERVFVTCQHQEIIGLFRRIVDLKNTITIAKCLRWKLDSAPELINGGHLWTRKVDQVLSEASLEKMVRRFAGNRKVTAADLLPINLEPLLYDHLSKVMVRRMRNHGPVVCCIGYVWQCFMASRKLCREFHTARFERYFPVSSESVQ